MKSLSTSLLVSLSIGVAAPVAALPRAPVARWPGVSDVLLNVKKAAPVARSPRAPVARWPRANYARRVTMGTPSQVGLWPCSNFDLVRVFAAPGYFDPTDEVNTSSLAPGVVVFHRTNIEVGDGCDTIYITLTGVGEISSAVNGQGEMQLGCFVDSSPCKVTTPNLFNPDEGFVAVFSDVLGAVDDVDFGATVPVTYTWCLAATPGLHDVQINLASGNTGNDVSLSRVWLYIDASTTGGASSTTGGGCTTDFNLF